MVDHTAEQMSKEDITNVNLNMDKIVLATDGSKYSVQATKTAVALAKLVDAKINAIFIDTSGTALPEEKLEEETLLGVHPDKAGLEVAKKFGEKNGVEVNTEVLKGNITKQIINYADENEADLIILGESGRTGLARLALGSVAESVVKAAHVPVFVDK